MSILDRAAGAFNRFIFGDLNRRDSAGALILGGPRQSAVWPNYDIDGQMARAYRLAVVMACIDAIARDVSAAPLRVYRETDDGNQEEPRHPARVVIREPNPSMSESEFWFFVVSMAAATGFCVVEKVRSGAGRPVELWPLVSPWIKVKPRSQAMPDWEYRVPGNDPWLLSAEDVIVVTYRPDMYAGFTGRSPLSSLRRELAIDDQITDFLNVLLERGGVPPLGLKARPQGEGKTVPKFSQAEADMYTDQFAQKYGGTRNWGKPVFLGGFEVEKIGLDLGEMLFPDVREYIELHVCCEPNTGIVTKRGVVPIQSVVIGDEVVTHRGRWQKVTALQRTSAAGRRMVEVTAKGLDPLRVTADHPVYSALHTQSRSHKADVERFDWVPAGDLRRKKTRGGFDALTVPMLATTPERSVRIADHIRPNRISLRTEGNLLVAAQPMTKSIPAEVPLSPALGRLLGYYLAEGSGSNGGIFWYFAEHETAYQNEVLADLREVFGIEGRLDRRGSVTAVQAHSALLRRFLPQGTARTKRIPDWAWGGDDEFRAAMLQAWANGDGDEDARNVRVTTCSRDLAWGMRLVAISLGLPASIRTFTNKGRVIRGRPIKSGSGFVVAWKKDRDQGRTGTYLFAGHHLTSPVRSVTDIDYDGTVYNLAVEGDESYLTTGGMVHNCTAFGVPAGMIGTAAGLARNTYSNAETDLRKYYDGTIAPLWSRLDGAFTRGLLREYDPAGALEMDFDVSDIAALQEDEAPKWDQATRGLGAGLMMLDEARAHVGLPALPNKSGEIFTLPFSVTLVKQSDLLAEATPQPVPPALVPSTENPPQEPPGGPGSDEEGDERALTFSVRQTATGTRYGVEGEHRDRLHTRSKKTIARLSKKAEPLLRTFWRKQGERIAAAAVRSGVHSVSKPKKLVGFVPEQDREQYAREPGSQTKHLLTRDLTEIDWDYEEDELGKVLRRLYLLSGETAFAEVSGQLGVEIAFDLANPNVRRVMDRLGQRIVGISATTQSDVQRVVGEALDEGVSIAELSDRLSGLFEETYRGRATVVARTESQTAYNSANVLGYEETGQVAEVELLDNPLHGDYDGDADGLTCAQRNGMVVPLGQASMHIEGTHPACILAVSPVLAGAPLGAD